jgi:predicted AlkP superfamily pyrophosphatase or phosphodiesterase
MKRAVLFTCLLFGITCSFAQTKSSASGVARPKLVVGIVIDQMRWDYLYRYAARYKNTGFKRLLTQGFSCENTLIPYTPTYTAAGHTCIYTGSVPAIHGIMGNNWYIRSAKKVIYCTDDDTAQSVGTTSVAGRMSPQNMTTTTVTDELRLATNFQSKVVGVALKDRGAILPAGHTANAAYWFDDTTGNWITSTFYMKELPQWAKDFNAKRFSDAYLQRNWNTLYPINTYTLSDPDVMPYEGALPGEDNSFPHITANITKNKYYTLRYTPYGNDFTLDMAKAAIEGEQLGAGTATDFLAVSLSSTDYIGHTFGPNSIEAEDTYLRLDESIGNFLTYLDNKVGKGNYVIFLSADHGAAHVADFAKAHNIPGGHYEDIGIQQKLNKDVSEAVGINNAVASVINYQVYLSESLSEEQKEKVIPFIIRDLIKIPCVDKAIALKNLENEALPKTIKTMLTNGYNQRLSGDIQFTYRPQWYDHGSKGTTHGAWYPYDAHIPLLFYGWQIPAGKTNRETYMTDIAPTLAALLHIQMPSGNIGNVIQEVVK